MSQKNNGRIIRLKRLSLYLLLSASIFIGNSAKAQDESPIADNFSINLNAKNMHLWHGSVVTPGIMMATSMEYTSPGKKITLGLWGGASFNGDYKEFSYYANYRFIRNFSVGLISHNNYSDKENPNIFSYDKHTSPNFVDVVLEYTVSDKLPLSVYWSTILAGRGGDYDIGDDGSVTDSYSNYAELKYRVFKTDKMRLSLFAGGAFSFSTDKTFYSEKANMVNLGLSISRQVNILSGTFPVSATAFWNPETKVGALQFDMKLF